MSSRRLYAEKGDILKHQLTFKDCGMTLKNFKDADDFVKNYPFAPYQFQLIQKSLRGDPQGRGDGPAPLPWRAVRSSTPSSRRPSKSPTRMSASWCRCTVLPVDRELPRYGGQEDDRSGQGQRQPGTASTSNCSQVLFLIRYVEEIKGNVDNLVTLCMEQIDADRLTLRQKIEESLRRLEKETLISRNGDVYFFLTNEERDINREIKAVEIGSGEEAKLLGEIDLQRCPQGAAEISLPGQQDGLHVQPAVRPASGRQSGRWRVAGLGHHAAERRLRLVRERQVHPGKRH